MIKIIYYFCITSFLFSEDVLFSVGDVAVYRHDFFQQISYNEWQDLDSLGKESFLSSFLGKELAYIDALSIGLDVFPENYIKTNLRYNQLLVNNTYEKLVAHPLIPKNDLELAEKNLPFQVLAHHILIGYDGGKLSGSFGKTQQEAFDFSIELRSQILKSFEKASPDSLISTFSFFAEKNSDDPSVINNKGYIGQISWGRVMPAFQKTAFALKPFSVSEPILTPYGYHLILVEEKSPSEYSYYNQKLLKDLSYKVCLQTLSFDSLRAASEGFDTSVLNEKTFFVNDPVLKNVFLAIDEKITKENLRGNKTSYIKWVSDKNYKEVLFVFKNKGFGVGWFLNQLKKMPATRVTSIKKQEDVLDMLKSFVLQESAIELGKSKKVSSSLFFQHEFLNHKKNILYNEYISYLINNKKGVDSSSVKSLYTSGVFKGDYVKPKTVVYSEIRTKTKEEIDLAYSSYLLSEDFDETLSLYNGKIKAPVSLGSGGVLTSTAFDLNIGEVSPLIENTNGTFSIIRVEKFVEAEPFTLARVYKQIERKIIKNYQDSIKTNLTKNLKNKYKIEALNL